MKWPRWYSSSAKGTGGVALMARLAKSIWSIISVALKHGA